MYIEKKLRAMPYAQAKVIINDAGTHLISYTTEVACIDSDGFFEVFGLYSATTRRHISAFAREYCGCDYQLARRIYEKREAINIFTGEVVDI